MVHMSVAHCKQYVQLLGEGKNHHTIVVEKYNHINWERSINEDNCYLCSARINQERHYVEIYYFEK